jgi:hypothetical protein
MPIAEIGRWEFIVPDAWALKDVGIGISYMEAPDGTRGMYAKTVASNPAEPSPAAFATYIQGAHQRGFEKDTQANWSVMEHSGHPEGNLFRSRLDLWDVDSSYRVLSLILCSAEYALQLTLHDYECKDYESTKLDFAEVEQSMRLAAGAA